MTTNPLLDMQRLPAFQFIRPEHVEPALEEALSACRAELDRLLDQPEPTWDRVVVPFERMQHRLASIWSPVRHLNAVLSSDELRDVYNRSLPKLSEYHTELAQNRRLYEAYKAIAERAGDSRLSSLQQRVLGLALRDFHLGGVDLPADAQQRFKDISRRLTELGARFEDNVLDATGAWIEPVEDPSELQGLPEHALALLANAAAQRNRSGYALTLDFPDYLAVMTHADARAVRERLYKAYTTRASDQYFDTRWDNAPVMEEILRLRHELAGLLGYENYAQYSLANKMASTPEEVIDFLRSIALHAKPFALKEKATLEAFARDTLGYATIEPWDILYLTEKFKKNHFDLTQEALRPYFPLERVLWGIFALLKRLFGITAEAQPGVETWHPDVRFFELRDASGELRGQLFLDMYARPRKRSGAWMDECRGRMNLDGTEVVPVAYLTCNAAPPVGDKPALLTHDEVVTLLHEFGHGLHHLLTRVDMPSVAGISGVEWDAVELPSQWMENFAWYREGLELLSAHYQTGEPLPEALLEKLLAVKKFQTGMQFVRQLEFALFDMRLHAEYDPDLGARIPELLAEVRAEVAVFEPPAYNRFQNTFSHIFGGGYAAGYYSYKWAEVLSADAFGRFVEAGILSREAGDAFLKEILEVGSSRPAIESFVAFRGRAPRIDTLLVEAGFKGVQ